MRLRADKILSNLSPFSHREKSIHSPGKPAALAAVSTQVSTSVKAINKFKSLKTGGGAGAGAFARAATAGKESSTSSAPPIIANETPAAAPAAAVDYSDASAIGKSKAVNESSPSADGAVRVLDAENEHETKAFVAEP